MASRDEINNLQQQQIETEQQAVAAQSNLAIKQKLFTDILKELIKSGQFTLKEGQDLSKTSELLNKVLKERIKQEQLVTKAVQEATKADRKLAEVKQQEAQVAKQKVEEAKKPNFLKNFFSLNSFRDDGKNSFEEMMRAKQRVQGIGDIFSGNIMSGVRLVGTSFKGLATFMKGPYYIALETSVKKLSEFDKALSKATKTSALMAGGITSSVGQSSDISRWSRGIDRRMNEKIIKYPLYEIGMQKRFDDYSTFIGHNFGTASLQGIDRKRDLYKTLGYAEYGLGASGISPDSAMNLVSNLRTIEGKSSTGIYAQIERFLNRTKTSSILSPEQALQQATSLYDQTKHLGTNFEWASRMVQAFEYQLKKGTMSLSDFAAGNRALQSGGVSKNAGIAALLTDYATRTGIALPTAFTRSNAVGQGFALSSPEMLGSNAVAKAMSGKITEMIGQMGMTTKYEKAGALQLILQSMGINVSATAASNAIRSDGTVNLQSAGIMGGSAFQKKALEEQEAKNYQEQVKNFYKNTESYQKTIADTLSMFFSYYKLDVLSNSIQDNAYKSQLEQWRAFASGLKSYKGMEYSGTREEAQEIFAQLVQQATM